MAIFEMTHQNKKNAILLLGDENFYIPMYFKRIGETTEEIFMSITQDKFYKVRSKVRKQTFESFLDYWQTNKLPKIDSENYYEYFLLSQEFSILSEQILLPKYEHIFKICLLKTLEQNEENTDKTYTEKLISQDIDFYLENHLDQLFSLPITSLYNIFNDRNCNISNYEQFYHIILSKSSQNSNFFVLLGLIKSDKLKDETFIDSSIKRNERYGFYPQLTETTINSIRQFEDDTKLILNENKLLKTQIIQMEKIQKSSENKITDYLKQIDQLTQEMEKKQQEIEKINKNFSCFQDESNEKIKKLREEIEKLNSNSIIKRDKQKAQTNCKSEIDDDLFIDDDDDEVKEIGFCKSQKVEFNKPQNKKSKMFSKTLKMKPKLKEPIKKNRQIIDILFVIDATNSNKNDLDMLCEKASNLAFNFITSNRASNIKFGCICCFELNLNRKSTQVQKLTNFVDINSFFNFLDDVKKNFEIKPFEYIKVLESAVNNFSWRIGKKTIVCISGSSFKKTEENERNLTEKVTKLITKDISFIALKTSKESYEAFLEIKKIYEAKDGPLFHIEDEKNDVNLDELINKKNL